MAGPPPTNPSTADAGQGTRLAWLDVLRGVAALCVVFDHMTSHLLVPIRSSLYQFFDLGNYGVFVFFIISGYIVPASLERKGSVRTFWVSRMFRLYPLYVVTIGIAVALWQVRLGGLHGAGGDPETSVLSQLLMMSNVLAGPNLPNVVWSLSYEMVFYLLLVALFAARIHRRSSWYALGFAAAAVALGGLLPRVYFSHTLSTPRLIAVAADLLLLAGLAAAVALRGKPRVLGAGAAAVVALALLAFNGSWIPPWEALAILALMFTGTVLYRAEQGQYRWPHAIAVSVVVLGLAIAAGLWHSRSWGMSAHSQLIWDRRWVTSFLLAGLTFGAGLAFRHLRWPRALTWLGLISYSMYLLHPILLELYRKVAWLRHNHPLWLQALLAAAFGVVLIAVSSLSYLAVEMPMQNVGRRVARWLDHRFGSDRVRERVPAGEPVVAGARAAVE